MKKYIFLFLCFSSSLWAAQTLEEMLQEVAKNSYEKESYELTQKKVQEKEKHIKRGDFQDGLILSGEYREYHRENQENNYTQKAKLQSGPFFVSGYHKNRKEADYIGVGFEKNIKDLFYSPYASEEKQNNLLKKKEEARYRNQLEEKFLSLVDLYRQYQDTFMDLQWKKEQEQKILLEEKRLQRLYELGNAKRIDWEAAKVYYQNLLLEIKTLEQELEMYQKKFEIEYRISKVEKNLHEIPLLTFDPVTRLESYRHSLLEEKHYQISLQEEVLQYTKYVEKFPDIKVSYEHFHKREERENEDVVALSFSKKLFSDEYVIQREKREVEELQLEFQETQRKLSIEKKQKEQEYQSRKSRYEVAKNRYELEEKRYRIKQKEYEFGKVDYIEVLDQFDKYSEANTNFHKERNALAAYLYEIDLRSK